MKKYKTNGIVTLFSGRVGLSREQLPGRAMRLRDIGDGTCEVLDRIEFKAGEIIGLENPDKELLKLLIDLNPAIPEPIEPEPEPEPDRRRVRPTKR